MTSADWIFTGIVAVSLLVGLWRGLVFEVLSLVGWVVAFFMAQWLAVSVSVQLPLQGLSDPVRYAVGFALIFLVCVVAAGLLASLSRKIISVAGLLPIDRLMGAAFGALRGLVILLAVAVVIDLTPPEIVGLVAAVKACPAAVCGSGWAQAGSAGIAFTVFSLKDVRTCAVSLASSAMRPSTS